MQNRGRGVGLIIKLLSSPKTLTGKENCRVEEVVLSVGGEEDGVSGGRGEAFFGGDDIGCEQGSKFC